MNTQSRMVLALAASLLVCSAVNAQRPANAPGAARGEGPGAQRFLDNAPQIGDLFPDVAVVDDQGAPVNIRDIAAENYSVLVLGCLT